MRVSAHAHNAMPGDIIIKRLYKLSKNIEDDDNDISDGDDSNNYDVSGFQFRHAY